MFDFLKSKDACENGKTYTLPPVPTLAIPESVYEPIHAAITRWRALKEELEAKKKEIPALEEEYGALAVREFDEECLLTDQRAAVKQKVAAVKETIDVLERFKISKALVAVWAAAVQATNRESDFTSPHDEKCRAFEAARQVIAEELEALRWKVRSASSNAGRDFYSGTFVHLGLGREREAVSEGIIRKRLAGIPEPPVPQPEPEPRGKVVVLGAAFAGEGSWYLDGIARKEVPGDTTIPPPAPISCVVHARPNDRAPGETRP